MAIPKVMVDQLRQKGYDIEPDSDRPGMFIFSNRKTKESGDLSYPTFNDAVYAAINHSRGGVKHLNSASSSPALG